MSGAERTTLARPNRFKLPRVAARNLSEEVHTNIRAAILGQDIQPGTRLFEADLAASLGVSRAPVREAIRQLEQEGLVHSFPRRGATVVALPEDEIEAFYELRADIEARAAARACEFITDADLAFLEDTLEELRRALEAADVDAIAEADVRFHRTVLDVSGFTLLKQVWSSLEGPLRIRVYQFSELEGPGARLTDEGERHGHRVQLEALRARDPERAAAVARGHVLDVREHLERIGAPPGLEPLDVRRVNSRPAGPR
jgi:DNA-binding GntR family transcriptional regulator